jgi:hypothetical protein
MSGFDERQAKAETKFVLDAAKEFKAEAKRNKALGIWAAEFLGKDPEKYALEVIMADMEEAGDDDVFRKLKKDQAIRDKMAECLAAAREEVYGA